MKELVVWAHSYCRSTLAFYRGLGLAFNVPLKIVVWKESFRLRTDVGFSEDEFDDLDITFLGDDYEKGKAILEEHKTAHHLFGAYQSVAVYQKLICDAQKMGCHIGIASESPCNMSHGFMRPIKQFYMSYCLPIKLRKQIHASDFLINFSGNDNLYLKKLGWNYDKIIPCGYFSPRIENTHCVRRTIQHWSNFSILLSGIHQWHRSPMLLLEALKRLKDEGLCPECNITQNGPLLEKMKIYAQKHHLDNVHFLGFVPMDKLVSLYEQCSVYVGAGNYEPWGMRLNDVLQCGAPLVVNKGMGGVKLVDDYDCGLSFERNDAHGLAMALKALISDKDLYLQKADNAYKAAECIKPETKANEIATILKTKFEAWQ